MSKMQLLQLALLGEKRKMKSEKLKLSEHLTSSSVAALSHSSELDGLRLSPHFTLAELCKTRSGIKNVPNEAQVENLRRVCRWLERLRRRYNQLYVCGTGVDVCGTVPQCDKSHRWDSPEEPIIINSGFRSAEVNRAVGGSATSNHLSGCAVDIRVAGIEQLLRYAVILLDISDESKEDFDELLLEKKGPVMWLHFAVRPTENRREIRNFNFC
jgi:uncharacterized protein YcbK (DUF882 family)